MFVDQPMSKSVLHKIEEASKVATQEESYKQAMNKLMDTYDSLSNQILASDVDFVQMFDLAKEQGPLLATHVKSMAKSSRATFIEQRTMAVVAAMQKMMTMIACLDETWLAPAWSKVVLEKSTWTISPLPDELKMMKQRLHWLSDFCREMDGLEFGKVICAIDQQFVYI